MPNYSDDIRAKLAMTREELGRGEDFPATQNVTGYSTYQGGYEAPENTIPMSPEILDYLQGKMPERFSPQVRQGLVDQSESAGKSLVLPELIANLGGAISGQGGMAASPYFDKLRQRQYEQTVGQFDKEKAAEGNRLMDIAHYLRLANRPQWSAEADRAKLDLERDKLEGLLKWRNFKMEQAPLEQELKKRNVAAREADVKGKSERFGSSQVAAYQDDLTRAGIPEATSIINTINKTLPASGEIPGWKQGQFLPDASLPPEAVPGIAAIRSLFNITLKNRSGAAVTDHELARLKGEFFAGRWATSEQLRQGIKNYQNRLLDMARGIAGGYSPEVQKQYLENIKAGVPVSPEQTATPGSATMSLQEKLLLLKQLMEKAGK